MQSENTNNEKEEKQELQLIEQKLNIRIPLYNRQL